MLHNDKNIPQKHFPRGTLPLRLVLIVTIIA
jgi:hypothetical protein